MHGNALIPHEQLTKEGAAKVLIKPAAHGTGVIAGGIRACCIGKRRYHRRTG